MIGGIALALYLPGFWWGAPHATAPDRIRAWGTDDLTPLSPLADIHNILQPKPDRNLGYPLLHSFILSAAYAPYLSYLWITGRLVGVSATYPYGLLDPAATLRTLTHIGHLLSVLMGVGIVVAVYWTGRLLWNRRTALLASLFVLTSFPMFYYARTGNVDVPMLFFSSLVLLVFARILSTGFSTASAVHLGLFVGLAMGVKEQSFALFVAVPPALLILQRSQQGSKILGVGRDFWISSAIFLGVAFLAFGLGSGLFVDPERYFAHIEFARQRFQDFSEGEVIFASRFPGTPQGHLQVVALFSRHLSESITLPGTILAVIGFLYVARRERVGALFAMPALTYLAVLFFSVHSSQLRYLMPVAYLLSFLAARILVVAFESSRVPLRVFSVFVSFGIFGVGVLRGIDLTHAMITDSRIAAGEWLQEYAQAGDRVEHFGVAWKLPPLETGISTAPALPWYGGTYPLNIGAQAVEQVVHGWAERRPDFVIVMPDYTSSDGLPHSAACPPAIYEGLVNGTLGYRLAEHFESPSLIPWIRRPSLDYPTVNPPIRIFVPAERVAR